MLCGVRVLRCGDLAQNMKVAFCRSFEMPKQAAAAAAGVRECAPLIAGLSLP